MRKKLPSILAAFLVMLSTSTISWSQGLAIATPAGPPADVIAMPKGSVDKALARLPAVIADIMQRSQVPGMAVAVVHGNRTLYAKGFGRRDISSKDSKNRVDEHTLFQIASISKSLSATLASMAVSDSKASWDDPVSRFLPDFKLGNDYVSKNATIGDFFAHRSGLPPTAGDELEDLGFSRADVLQRLQQLPLDPFRISYHYANFSTTIGAEAVAAAEKQSWEELAEDRLFKPLGMKDTSYRYADFQAHENRARLHAYQNGRFKPFGERNADAQAPAGGVSSNVVDLAEWLKLLLANGKHDGRQLIAPDALLPALSPQSFSARPHDTSSRSGFYGYGFNTNIELGGRPSMGHSGAFLLGAGTSFRIVPSADIGIIVLTNGAPIGAAEAVVASFTDLALYGKTTRDWFDAYHGAMLGFFEPQGDLSTEQPPKSPKAARELRDYVGHYDNAFFGPADISEKDGGLVMQLGPKAMQFPLQHWDDETFAFTPIGEAELVNSRASLKFGLTSDAKSGGFEIRFYNGNGLGQWIKQQSN